ncbi:MAG: hypothetical protein R3200_01595 [Xanthomonadales bacterium]|nr:hypothetical protein [Xanthomonadales bacterium]
MKRQHLLVPAGLCAAATLGVQYVIRPDIGQSGWAAWTAWTPSLFFAGGCILAARTVGSRFVLISAVVFVLAFEGLQRWHPGLTFSVADLIASAIGITIALAGLRTPRLAWGSIGLSSPS